MAPMFAHTVGHGPPCVACSLAGRRIIIPGQPQHLRPVRVRILSIGGVTFEACPICDQNPLDAPAWRCT